MVLDEGITQGLEVLGSVPDMDRDFSLLRPVQTTCGAHPGAEASGTCGLPLTHQTRRLILSGARRSRSGAQGNLVLCFFRSLSLESVAQV